MTAGTESRLGRLVLIGGLFVLTLAAAPDGCNGVYNVSLDPTHMHPSSPNAEDSTYEDPAIVMRDNPQLQGALIIHPPGVSGTRQGAYGAHGSWENLVAQTTLTEMFSPSRDLVRQRIPLLPAMNDDSPGVLYWRTRSGDLIHENVFRAEVFGVAGANYEQAIQSPRPLFVRLSDEVALVPVVVVSFREPGDPDFRDMSFIAKSLFDFIPYARPRYTASELRSSDVLRPNQERTITAPDWFETPPDEIFSACKVQFQVVASFVFDLEESPRCLPSFPSFMSRGELDERVRNALNAAHPRIGDHLVDLLRPVYLGYGNLEGCNFAGKRVGSLIEVSTEGRYDNTTAHELGHLLGNVGSRDQGDHSLDHEGNPLQGNLMSAGATGNALTGSQCASMYATAMTYSDRFRAFNQRTGRTRTEFAAVGSESTTPITTDDGLLMRCCEIDGSYTRTALCGGVEVAESYCRSCCVVGDDVEEVWMNECAPESVVSAASCDAICCSTFGADAVVTRYACDESGGYEIACTVEPPQ